MYYSLQVVNLAHKHTWTRGGGMVGGYRHACGQTLCSNVSGFLAFNTHHQGLKMTVARPCVPVTRLCASPFADPPWLPPSALPLPAASASAAPPASWGGQRLRSSTSSCARTRGSAPASPSRPSPSWYGGVTGMQSGAPVWHFSLVIPGARPLAYTIPHGPFRGEGSLTHLCNLEAGYGGVWAPNFGGAAPGIEPGTSCLRVRSVTITLRGPPQLLGIMLPFSLGIPRAVLV